MVTRAELYKLCPKARPDMVDAIVRGWPKAVKAGFTNNKRVRLFLANLAAETGGLTILEESMNYTTAKRLMQVWPTRFKTVASAQPYVRDPIKLAQKVYGGRMGNAPAPSLDGWNYRGGGMIQTTGRSAYAKHGFEKNPDALRKNPDIAFETAVNEWVGYKLHPVADRYDARRVRRVINGGYNGWAHAEMYRKRAEKIWPDGAEDKVNLAAAEKAAADADLARINEIKSVQRKLLDLGYSEVGRVDGSLGKYTRAAILAFRDDNGLPAVAVIDKPLLDMLKVAPKRTYDDDRETTPAAQIRSEVPEVSANFFTKVVSLITTVISAIVSFFYGLAEYVKEARDQLDPVRDFLYDVPGWIYLALLMIISGTLYYTANKGEQAGVKAYRKGKRRA